MTKSDDTHTILALNSGSSSLKFGLYRVGSSKIEILVSGGAEAIGETDSTFHAIGVSGAALLSATYAATARIHGEGFAALDSALS